MQNFNSYLILHNFRRHLPSHWIIFLLFSFINTNLSGQTKTIYHGRDKQTDSLSVITGDKYYDSGGAGGSRLPDQPGNYFNCIDPFNESTNCTSIYTFCSGSNDTVALNFNDYLIVTGDRFKIFSGTATTGPVLFNSQTQGVSLNGMKLTTGTLIKSKATNGCITVEMFATTIGNSIGWDADFIVFKQNLSLDPCVPVCNENVNIVFPIDTCYQLINTFQFVSNFNSSCSPILKLFYPSGTDDLNSKAVNNSHLGKRFLFEASDSTGSSCVGYLKVTEPDYSIPFCLTDTMSCIEWENSLADLKKISTCSGKGYSVLSSEFISFDCENDIIGLVIRKLALIADSGKVEFCADSIFIKRISGDTIQKPMDIKLNCSNLNEDATTWSPVVLLQKFDLNNDYRMDESGELIIPLLGGQPLKDTSGFCYTSLHFSDLVIPGCGVAYKIRRQWRLSSGCNNIDSTFVQYISVEDKEPPLPGVMEALNFTIPSGSCLATFTIDSLQDIKDCGYINQKLEITYPDPTDPGKQIVINTRFPVSLTLPAGPYSVKYTFTDPCFNVTQQNQCLWITRAPDLRLAGDTIISKQVDTNSCFARVYASDFESYVKPACSEKLHFAIAHEDTILFYQNYWKNKFMDSCSTQHDWLLNQSYYTDIIENWINTNIYTDFIDLPSCEQNKISIKVFDVSQLPAKDALFDCSGHAWISYHIDPLFRKYFNEFKSCEKRNPLFCSLDSNFIKNSNQYKFNFYTSEFLNDSNCRSDYFLNEFEQIRLSAVALKITINVKDTFLNSIPNLPDIVFVEDNQNTCCNDLNCAGEVFSPLAWPGKLECSSCGPEDFIRNYSGPAHSSAVYESIGHYYYPGCNEYDSIRFFKPVYCRDYITTSRSSAIDKDSLFYSVILNGISTNKNTIPIGVNCLNSWKLQFSDTSFLSTDCTSDTLIRKWVLIGNCNQFYTFSQRLILKKKADFEVLFPEDAFIDCSVKQIKDSVQLWKRFGYPVVHSSPDNCIEVTYKDSLISTGKIDYCLLTQRVWKIIDLAHYTPGNTKTDFIINDSAVADYANRYCVYRNLKDGGDGVMYYKQMITYIDSVPPVFHLADTLVHGSNCMAPAFKIKITVTDDCTQDDVLFSQHSLDLYSNGTYEHNYQKEKGMVYFSEGLPPGIHRFRSISSDLCGNTDTAYTNLTITDDGAPMAYCVQSSVLVPIPVTKSIQILAKDFDAGSLAGCEKGPLKFSFSTNSMDSSRVYTCDSIGDKVLSVYITNTAENQSVCSIKLQVISDSICKSVSTIISINGNVMNPNKAGINRVDIKTNALLMKTSTNENGVYQLKSLVPGQNITLVPDKMDEPLNGISAVDLLIIERHIKGLSLITDPYQLIAADVNRSGSVTITDLIELRKMILGSITFFSNNKDWIFIPESYKFNDPLAPWIYPETISYNPVTNSLSDVNFIGIKVGDVNNSAIINAQQLESRENSASMELLHTTSTFPGFQLHSFYLSEPVSDANAFQFALNLSPGQYQLYHENGLFRDSAGLYYTFKDNELKLVWTHPEGLELHTHLPLFTIKTNTSFPAIQISNSSKNFLNTEKGNYSLKLVESQNVNNFYIQAYPNPSSDIIYLRFYLNDLLKQKVLLTNMFGKKFDHLIPPLIQGWNHISLNKNDLGGSGQFFFYLHDGKIQNGKKFIMF